jgi:hypothetical protein
MAGLPKTRRRGSPAIARMISSGEAESRDRRIIAAAEPSGKESPGLAVSQEEGAARAPAGPAGVGRQMR